MSKFVYNWIRQLSGKKINVSDQTSLSVALCRSLNSLQSGTVKKVSNKKPGYNLKAFLEGCQSLGISKKYLFDPSEVLENDDLSLIVKTLKELSKKYPERFGGRINKEKKNSNRIELDDSDDDEDSLDMPAEELNEKGKRKGKEKESRSKWGESFPIKVALQKSKKTEKQLIQSVQRNFGVGSCEFEVTFLNENGDKHPCTIQLQKDSFTIVILNASRMTQDYSDLETKLLLSPTNKKLIQLQMTETGMMDNSYGNYGGSEFLGSDEDEQNPNSNAMEMGTVVSTLLFKFRQVERGFIFWKTFDMFKWYKGDSIESYPISGKILGKKHEIRGMTLRCVTNNKAMFKLTQLISRTEQIVAILMLEKVTLSVIQEQKNKRKKQSYHWGRSQIQCSVHSTHRKVIVIKIQDKGAKSIVLKTNSDDNSAFICECINHFSRMYARSSSVSSTMRISSLRNMPSTSSMLFYNPQNKPRSQSNYFRALTYSSLSKQRGLTKTSQSVKRDNLIKKQWRNRKNLLIGTFNHRSESILIQLQPITTLYSISPLVHRDIKKLKKKYSDQVKKYLSSGNKEFKVLVIGDRVDDTVEAKFQISKRKFEISTEKRILYQHKYKPIQRIMLHSLLQTIFILYVDERRTCIMAAKDSDERDLIANTFILFKVKVIEKRLPPNSQDLISINSSTGFNVKPKREIRRLITLQSMTYESQYQYDKNIKELEDENEKDKNNKNRLFNLKDGGTNTLELYGLDKTKYVVSVFDSFGDPSGNAIIYLYPDHFSVIIGSVTLYRYYNLYSKMYIENSRSMIGRFNIDEFFTFYVGFKSYEERIGFTFDFDTKRNKNMAEHLSKHKVYRCIVISTFGRLNGIVLLRHDCFTIKTEDDVYCTEYTEDSIASPYINSSGEASKKVIKIELGLRKRIFLNFTKEKVRQEFEKNFNKLKDYFLKTRERIQRAEIVPKEDSEFICNLIESPKTAKGKIKMKKFLLKFQVSKIFIRELTNSKNRNAGAAREKKYPIPGAILITNPDQKNIIKILFWGGLDLICHFNNEQLAKNFKKTFQKFQKHYPDEEYLNTNNYQITFFELNTNKKQLKGRIMIDYQKVILQQEKTQANSKKGKHSQASNNKVKYYKSRINDVKVFNHPRKNRIAKITLTKTNQSFFVSFKTPKMVTTFIEKYKSFKRKDEFPESDKLNNLNTESKKFTAYFKNKLSQNSKPFFGKIEVIKQGLIIKLNKKSKQNIPFGKGFNYKESQSKPEIVTLKFKDTFHSIVIFNNQAIKKSL